MVKVSVDTVMKHGDPKQYMENNILLGLTFIAWSIINQGHNLEAGADAEDKGEYCLLACFLWLPYSEFLQNSRPPDQRMHHP